MTIMRLEEVILNERIGLLEKSKVALKTANAEGHVPDKDGNMDNLRITGVLYTSQDSKETEKLTFEQYKALENPEYIIRMDDGSLSRVPDVLIPRNFPPKEFD